MQEYAREVKFPASVLFTDEITFYRDGVFNHYDQLLWFHENPFIARHPAAQHCFKVNVWGGGFSWRVLRRIIPLTIQVDRRELSDPSGEDSSRLPRRLSTKCEVQHDGAPSHFGLYVRNHLNRSFPHRWIGLTGLTQP